MGNLSFLYRSTELPFHPPVALKKTSGISISHADVEAPCLIDLNEYYRGSLPNSCIRERI